MTMLLCKRVSARSVTNLPGAIISLDPPEIFCADNWMKDFRYTCEQNEGMAGYGWDEYDIRRGGRETIHDARNTLDLTIDFIKVPGGQHGGSWGARVKGVPREDAPAEQITTMVFYTTLEGLGNVRVANEADVLGFEGDVKFSGHTPDLGDFLIDVTAGPESNGHLFHSHPTYEDKPLDRTLVSSVNMPPEHLWQPKGIPDITRELRLGLVR